MKKSGLADSPFFASPKPDVEEASSLSSDTAQKPIVKENENSITESSAPEQTRAEIHRVKRKRNIGNPPSRPQRQIEKDDGISASMQASNNASMQAMNQPLTHETIIETIRKAVKDVGKDSATYRFTPEEKRALLELSFSYKMQGYKTSENELARISINFLLEDHRQNGRNSVLQRVLDALSK